MIARYAHAPAAALALAFACAPVTPAIAQSVTDRHPHEHMDGMVDRMRGPHVEGHIAFLKAELGITDAQAPLWEKVAAAMREDVAEMRAAMAPDAAAEQRPLTTLTYLERRARLTALRAQGEARFLGAFRPLYDAFSPAQRKTADELLVRDRP